MSGSFQTATYQVQAPGVAGDFASTNPRHSIVSMMPVGPNGSQTGIVAGPNGLTIGLFAWLDLSTASVASNSGTGAPNGIVHNEHQALITAYLGAYGMTIPAGFEAGCIFSNGDLFMVNNGTNEAVPGMKAYANNVNGQATFALTGNATAGGSGTASSIAATATNTFTGSITDNVMTVAASGLTGTVVVGATITGTGVAPNTKVTGQLTGTAGSSGTYTVTPRDQTVASTSLTGASGTLTVGGTVTGTFAVGQTLTGSGVTAGSYITALGTGTGGAGTYIVSASQSLSSQTIGTATNTETTWTCRSFGQPGDLVIVSSTALG